MKKKSILLLSFVIIIAVLLNVVAFIGYDFGDEFKYGGVFDETQGIRKGIDLAGGSVITFKASALNPSEAEMDVVEDIFRTRLTNSGYTEARISKDTNGQVTVEIPAVTDTDEAAQLLGTTAKLTFRNVDGDVVLDGAKGIKTAEYMYGAADATSQAEPYVQITLKPEAVSDWAKATREAAARPEGENVIAIYLDETLISAPRVAGEINQETCQISGGFKPEEAQMLANQIKSGNLPFDMELTTKETIGAELGKDALPTAMTAAGIGILLIMLFMLIVYRLPGVIASIAMAIYVGLIALILGLMRVNLSLSGIAGIITSLGMAVDANVIIFERMKEELKLGKTIKASVESGFNKAFSAILDSNVTTIISCVVLYLSGIGTIRGFAVTLGLGVIVSMFTAIVVTKFLLKQLVNLNIKNRKLYGAN